MKSRSDDRSRVVDAYVRSWRNGVAPMVKVTRSVSISRAASSTFQMSSHTAVAPSRKLRQYP